MLESQSTNVETQWSAQPSSFLQKCLPARDRVTLTVIAVVAVDVAVIASKIMRIPSFKLVSMYGFRS